MSAFDDILNAVDEDGGQEPASEPAETPTAEQPTADESTAAAPTPAAEHTPESDAAPAAVEAQPITREDGAVWSENAKRWYKDGKIVAGEAPAAPSEPSIPSVPEPQAPTPPSYAGDAFEVRGGGGKHAIPGAVLDKDGWLHVAPEHVNQTRMLYAAGIQHNANYGREKQQWQQQLATERANGEAKAQGYNKAAVVYHDAVIGTKDRDPSLLTAILRDLPPEVHQQVIATWQREAGYMIRDVQHTLRSAPKPAEPAQPEVTPEQLEQHFAANLGAAADEVLEFAPKGLFTAEDLAELKADVLRHMRTYAAEHPETGELVIDMQELRADLQKAITRAQKAQQAQAAARVADEKKRQAAAFNAANTPKPTAPTPKAPTPKPALAAAPSGTKRGWDQSFKGAWNDDDED